VNDEANDGDENARVGYIEGRPGMRERHVQIEKSEIDDVTVEETVGQVPHDAREEQRERDIAERIAVPSAAKQERENKNESDARKDDEKRVVVLERAESRAIVGHVHDREKIRDDDVNILGAHKPQDEPLCDLVQRIERE
jgi:hypothetical protein